MMPGPQLQYYETARMLVLRGSGKRHQPRLAGAHRFCGPLTDDIWPCNHALSTGQASPRTAYHDDHAVSMIRRCVCFGEQQGSRPAVSYRSWYVDAFGRRAWHQQMPKAVKWVRRGGRSADGGHRRRGGRGGVPAHR